MAFQGRFRGGIKILITKAFYSLSRRGGIKTAFFTDFFMRLL
jgi:hypothetical protein